jgi:hypothetical protein
MWSGVRCWVLRHSRLGIRSTSFRHTASASSPSFTTEQKLWSIRQGSSVADPDPGSGAFLTLGSGIRNRFLPVPRSRIPDPKQIYLDNFLGKKFYNSLKIGPNFFLQHFKNKIIYNFLKFVAKKRYDKIFFFTSLFFSCFWIRDPGSGINIPDPQHCKEVPRNCVSLLDLGFLLNVCTVRIQDFP